MRQCIYSQALDVALAGLRPVYDAQGKRLARPFRLAVGEIRTSIRLHGVPCRVEGFTHCCRGFWIEVDVGRVACGHSALHRGGLIGQPIGAYASLTEDDSDCCCDEPLGIDHALAGLCNDRTGHAFARHVGAKRHRFDASGDGELFPRRIHRGRHGVSDFGSEGIDRNKRGDTGHDRALLAMKAGRD